MSCKVRSGVARFGYVRYSTVRTLPAVSKLLAGICTVWYGKIRLGSVRCGVVGWDTAW